MKRISYRLVAAASAVLLCAALAQPTVAQRTPGNVGLGFQLGDPSGVSLQFYNPEPYWDFLAAWDFDDWFLLNVHVLFERPLGNRPDFYLFYGPGGFIGFHDRAGDDDFSVGISGTIGIGFVIEEFDIFARITPRLSLVPDTDGDIGGGIGARYWF